MESEDQDSYRPLKTAKTFVRTLEISFQKKEGEKLSRELKELYFTNNYANIPEKSWNVPINSQVFGDSELVVGLSFARVLQLARDFAAERAAGRWSDAFEKHMQCLIAVVKVLEEMKDYREWLSKPLRTVLRATKRIFLSAESNVTHSSAAAKLKNTLLNTLQRFKSARAIGEDVKKEFLPLIDIMQVSILLSFHNYEQIQRILYSNKIYGECGPRYIDNYNFQRGKYALVNENLKEAEECFSKITLRTRAQKKLVLRYLIPCKMLLGRMFNPHNSAERDEFKEYVSIEKAVLECNFKFYEELSQKYQKVWLKRGIYLLMDRMRILLWRNLVKRLYLLVGSKVELELIERAVRVQGGVEDLNECICIVGNLIFEGYIKGYIYQNQAKRTLVLKNNGAFPALALVSK